MASLGNIGRARLAWRTENLAASAWKLYSYASSADITGATPITSVLLSFRGVLVEEKLTDTNGDVSFFDLNPGVYSANQVSTGNAWIITAYPAAPPDVAQIATSGIYAFANFG